MREFVESIADMRCLHTVILRNNGIDDTYTDELGFISIIKFSFL